MKRHLSICLSATLILLCGSLMSQAQSWSGIIDPSRAIDWSNAGIPGGIPSASWAQSGSTIAAYKGDCSTIQNAWNNAGDNTYIKLGPGTFTISGGCKFSGHSNRAIRGSGPLSTTLAFTSSNSCSGLAADVCFLNSSPLYVGSSGVLPPCASNTNCADWTAGYAQGTTSITLKNVGSNKPTVGTLLMLDQANDTSCSVGTGLVQGDGTTNCSGNGGADGRVIGGSPAWAGGGSYVNGKYSQVQVVTVTSASCSSGTCTLGIFPGIYAANIRSSQTPGAWWAGAPDVNVGIEDMTVDHTASSGVYLGINYIGVYQAWAKNLRSLNGKRDHFYVSESAKVVIRDSYICGSQNGLCGAGSGGGEETYALEPDMTSDDVFENNIFEDQGTPVIGYQWSGSVFGYNYTFRDVFSNPNFLQVSNIAHDAGSFMNLVEGNFLAGVDGDNQHGASPLQTVFRNWIEGQQPAPNDKTAQTQPFGVDSINRAWNIVGNVLGSLTCKGGTYSGRACSVNADCTGGGSCSGPSYHNNYEASPNTSSANCNTSIYALGWGSEAAGCSAPGGGRKRLVQRSHRSLQLAALGQLRHGSRQRAMERVGSAHHRHQVGQWEFRSAEP